MYDFKGTMDGIIFDWKGNKSGKINKKDWNLTEKCNRLNVIQKICSRELRKGGATLLLRGF